jgi:two-component system cell cycle sensor histidine kinase/response regulator CckA
MVSQALERIERTARRVQSFAHPHGLKLESVDVNKAVEAMIELLGSTFGKNIEIATDLGKIPPVLSDFHTLQEVLFHLSTNALAAMPGGGRLTFRTSLRQTKTFEQNPQVTVEIIDTGCGIPRENYDRIFEPFFTTRSDNGGTGLGLSLCRILIFEMGGQIDVDSVVNQGTTFRILLNATEPILHNQKEFP